MPSVVYLGDLRGKVHIVLPPTHIAQDKQGYYGVENVVEVIVVVLPVASGVQTVPFVVKEEG